MRAATAAARTRNTNHMRHQIRAANLVALFVCWHLSILEPIRTVAAARLAAVSALQQVVGGENVESILDVVVEAFHKHIPRGRFWRLWLRSQWALRICVVRARCSGLKHLNSRGRLAHLSFACSENLQQGASHTICFDHRTVTKRD